MADQRINIQQKLLQKLSPQQIQVIKLLEIPAIQLEQRIKSELEENPILELIEDESPEDEYNSTETNDSQSDDEFSLEDYLNEEDIPSQQLFER
jgi:RNA polymerase sigma-54 factor